MRSTRSKPARPPQAPQAVLDRVDEIGGQATAEERIAERKALKAKAAAGAMKVVERAIRADEAGALKIPIDHNPNPAA
jgi:hypothetical protein